MTFTRRTCEILLGFLLLAVLVAGTVTENIFSVSSIVQVDCKQQTEAGGLEYIWMVYFKPAFKCCVFVLLYGAIQLLMFLLAKVGLPPFHRQTPGNPIWNFENVRAEYHDIIFLGLFIWAIVSWWIDSTKEANDLYEEWKPVQEYVEYCCVRDVQKTLSELPLAEREKLCSGKEFNTILQKMSTTLFAQFFQRTQHTVTTAHYAYIIGCWQSLFEHHFAVMACCGVSVVAFLIAIWCFVCFIFETDKDKKAQKKKEFIDAFDNCVACVKYFVGLKSGVSRRSAFSEMLMPSLPRADAGAADAKNKAEEADMIKKAAEEKAAAEFAAAVKKKAEEEAAAAKRKAAAAASLVAAAEKKVEEEAAAELAAAAKKKAEEEPAAAASLVAAETAMTLSNVIGAGVVLQSPTEQHTAPVVGAATDDQTTMAKKQQMKRDQCRMTATNSAEDTKRKTNCTLCTYKWCKRKRGAAFNGKEGTQFRCGEHPMVRKAKIARVV